MNVSLQDFDASYFDSTEKRFDLQLVLTWLFLHYEQPEPEPVPGPGPGFDLETAAFVGRFVHSVVAAVPATVAG